MIHDFAREVLLEEPPTGNDDPLRVIVAATSVVGRLLACSSAGALAAAVFSEQPRDEHDLASRILATAADVVVLDDRMLKRLGVATVERVVARTSAVFVVLADEPFDPLPGVEVLESSDLIGLQKLLKFAARARVT